jgi:Domain of unknown function (DUF4397)
MAALSLSHRLLAVVAAAVAAFGVTALTPTPAAAAGGGYVRLGHLVPDKIACDMYIQLHSVTGDVVKYLPNITYGGLSEYVMVPAGTYAVAMRKPGAPATDKPALSTTLTVADGRSYTVARMGSPDNAQARILEDDRTLPTGDKAKLRIVQAAQRTLDVSIADGPTLAKDVTFSTATEYMGVDPGANTLRVQPTGGQPITVAASVTAGNIYSLLVLEAPDGGVKASLLADAKRVGAVPKGGIDTGAGGTAPGRGGNGSALLLASLVAGVVALAAISRQRSRLSGRQA